MMNNKTQKPYAFVRNDSTAEICFYNDIGGWGCTLDQVKADLDLCDNLSSLNIRINSAGGDAYEGLGIFNYIRSLSVPVTVDIDGLAASAASIIAMSGDVIRMPRTAQMMIHEPWVLAVGDSDDLRGVADGLDALCSAMIAVYMTKATATKDEVAALVKAETWLSADDALKLGLITEISGETVSEVSVQDENEEASEEVLTAENAQAFLAKRMASVSKPQASALIDRVRASASAADTETVRENDSETKAETTEDVKQEDATSEQVTEAKASNEDEVKDESKEEDKKEEEKKEEANVIHLEIDIDPIALVELCKEHGEPEFARTAAKAKMSLKDVQAKLTVRSEIKAMANRFRAAATYIALDDAELLKFETVAQARTAIFAKLAESEAKIDSRPAAPTQVKTAKTELNDAVAHAMRNMYPNAYKR